MLKNSFILVSMREDYFSSISEWRDAIDKKLIKWIIKLGFVPILIPNSKIYDFYFKKYNLNIVGIILSGGGDINYNSSRYLTEKKLLRYSIKNKIPLLGICHGMQVISNFEGGKLEKIKNHLKKKHIILNKDQLNIYPKKVNSYHHYKIKNLSKDFNVLCTCVDGSIEAIKHKKYNWLGWMWHPEREKKFNNNLIKIARKFFSRQLDEN